MSFLTTVLFAFLGGVLPALAWLSFWLKEDAHPEPVHRIFKTFIYGMIAVPIALVFQFVVNVVLLEGSEIEIVFMTNYPIALLSLILWAGIEELVKYYGAFYAGLSSRDNNEPVDVMIYLITAALGFAALENTLFIFWPILGGDSSVAFITGNMRFIGSTLLHVATSSIIGIFIAFAYYKEKRIKKRHLLTGFTISVILHTVFNSFIIRAESFTITGFAMVWITIVVIILLFEKIKKIYFKRTGEL